MGARHRNGVSTAAVAVLVIVIIALAALEVFALNMSPQSTTSNGTTTSSSPTTSFHSTNSTATTNSTVTTNSTSTFQRVSESNSSLTPLGLRLDLGVNVTSAGRLTIQGDEFNTLSSTHNVSASDSWPLSPTLLNPYDDCQVSYPLGIGVLNGSYSGANFTKDNVLALYDTNYATSCTESAPITVYSFAPLSTDAKGFQGNSSYPYFGGPASLSSSTFGYWTGFVDSGVTPAFHTFSANQTYTAMAADEWGNIVFLHFRLTSSVSTSSISSLLCTNDGPGEAYVRVVSYNGPPIQNMTLTVTYTGNEVAGNFYCGGATFEIGHYSSSQGYVQISGHDGLLVAGQYDIQLSYNGVNYGAGVNVYNASDSTYYSIELPSLSVTAITCAPDSSCSAIQTTTSSCSSSSEASTTSPQVTNITIPSDFDGQPGNSGYQPSDATVVIGLNNTVTWTDDTSFPVSVTSTSVPPCGQPFDSGMLRHGQTFTVTFVVPGTYQYYTVFDQGVTGTIVVEA